MIPEHLTLSNFLSYGHCEVDFSGLHTVCISGANGAGKSALLESMGWALWGKCRAPSEDDLIRTGTSEATVDFKFRCDGQTYRVLRVRPRGKTGTLEFQIEQSPGQFRAVSGRTNRLTQDVINQVLKMDYETFINSVYLRQGRADEFTVKKASERKEVLAEILGLSRYDTLAEKAREKSREFKAQADSLKEQVQKNEITLATIGQIQGQEQQLVAHLSQRVSQGVTLETQAQLLQQQLSYRESLIHQETTFAREAQRQERAIESAKERVNRQQQVVTKLLDLLHDKVTIEANYQTYQNTLSEEETLNVAWLHYQSLSAEQHQLERELDQERHRLEGHLQSLMGQLEGKYEQRSAAQGQLVDVETVQKALANLAQAKENLRAYEERQAIAQPQLQERQRLLDQLKSERLALEAEYKNTRYQYQDLGSKLSKKGLLEKQLEQLTVQTQRLQKQKFYMERVADKGHESKATRQRYDAQLEECQKRQGELLEKQRLLEQSLSHCPLCSQELDEEHRTQIQQQQAEEEALLQEEVVLLQHQMSYLDQEIKVLRTEWAEIKEEVKALDDLLPKQGSLQQQLDGLREKEEQLKDLRLRERTLKTQLEEETYGIELRQQLQLLELELKRIDYNEHDFALYRSELERWRWAELKNAEIQRARQTLGTLDQEIPILEQRCANGRQKIQDRNFAPVQHQELKRIQTQLAELHYDPKVHQELKVQLQAARSLPSQYEALQQAETQLPEQQLHLTQLEAEAKLLQQEIVERQVERQRLAQALSQIPDPQPAIAQCQFSLQQNRAQQDQTLAQLGAYRQQLEELARLKLAQVQTQTALEQARHQHTLHRELAQAFGKNGIQGLIIESVLPELETEANQLLACLSENQLHVNFQSQRAAKSSTKLIETLDIFISDSRGTRPYETYSGGEAFRVNFAIRLALSRLLARRSGAALQTLIVDEGFGSQDNNGRERLIEAINVVAPAFARILVITHVSDLKEAFPARIEVEKGARGSHLSVVV